MTKRVTALVLGGVLLVPGLASAETIYRPSMNRLSSSWTKVGGAYVSGDTITLTEKEGESESVYQNISTPNVGGKWAFLVGYGKAETVRGNNDITGLPYLYGYAMDRNGKILSYLQRDNMRFSGKAGKWSVLHGAFHLPAGTTSIRYFVNQASRAGSAKYGDDAIVYKPALYIVDRFEDGRDRVNDYRFGLDLMNR